MIGPSLWGGPADPPCLLETFAAMVRDRADDVAVVDDDVELTYDELGQWIGELAAELLRRDVRPGDRVAVLGTRSAAIVAMMWAVVGVGATYVPLDTEYPARLVAHMLADSGARLVVHTAEQLDVATEVPALRLPGWSGRAGASGGSDGSGGSGGSDGSGGSRTQVDWPTAKCDPEEPVYVIYTSGSTGLPKGVALPHRSIDNMAAWQYGHSVRPDLRTAQFAPLNFDVWFQEVLGTLCGGGTLVVMPEALRRDPIALLDWLDRHGIERLFLPCVALHMLTVAACDGEAAPPAALAEINTAGEQLVCTPAIREFFRRLPGCRLNNHYGQSESAMVTVHTLTGPSHSWPALPPIGTPLPGCEVLLDVLDPAEPEVGELLVAGAPMSAGYHDRPELSALRYIDIPRTARGHRRAFRTGDLCRIQDGAVWFLARTDHEVKIRGFRVNPLEVDGCLAELPEVVEAVCVAVEVAQGSRQLRAAVTVAPGESFDSARALAELRSRLPAQSVPVSITVLPEFPRTPSGKLDRERVAQLIGPAARRRARG
ncbi:D-alanine--poly(phosphoribitol) ligase subunit 1 [Catenulispora sp. GP43]|uniref:AMP-binding protein n=1 Tax=Catenulispora sp. GP43 TaxID=3156263 RepID=UPI00351595FE